MPVHSTRRMVHPGCSTTRRSTCDPAADALLRLASPAPLSRNDLISRGLPATTANPRYSEGSVLVLSDGRLLYATTEFQERVGLRQARVIATSESADGGQTWSAPRVVQENVGKQNVMSVTLRRLRPGAVFDGPIGLFYLVKNSPTDLHVFVRTSEDEARSFGPPIQVTTAPGYHVMNNDRVTILKSGRILAPIASTGDVLKGGHFVSACVISDDLGKTWHHGRGHVDYGRRGAMEPEVVEAEDGRLFMHIRTQLGHIAVSESTDGGETWGEARSWEVRAPEAPSTVRVIPSTGHLLLIWNDTFRAGEGHGGRRTPLTAAISADGGKTWTHRRDLETDAKFTYAYTSITFDRGRALLTYYVRDEATGRISSRFRSVPIAWFYAGDAAP
ncbi:MAG: sialidase family protein [Isosphaeraceae bacterium]